MVVVGIFPKFQPIWWRDLSLTWRMTRGRKPRRRERAKLTMILLYSDCKWCLVYWVVGWG